MNIASGFCFSKFGFFWLFVWFFVFICLSHLLYLVVACRAGCHERWDELEPHGTPRLLELPRWVPVALEGIPPDWCHGAQRLGKALWFHDQDQPPNFIVCNFCVNYHFIWFDEFTWLNKSSNRIMNDCIIEMIRFGIALGMVIGIRLI